jgi:hypothetical protein
MLRHYQFGKKKYSVQSHRLPGTRNASILQTNSVKRILKLPIHDTRQTQTRLLACYKTQFTVDGKMALAVIRLPVSVMAKLWVKLLVTYCFYLFCQSNANSTTAMAKWSSELNKKHLVVLVSEVGNSIKFKHVTYIHLIAKKKM